LVSHAYVVAVGGKPDVTESSHAPADAWHSCPAVSAALDSGVKGGIAGVTYTPQPEQGLKACRNDSPPSTTTTSSAAKLRSSTWHDGKLNLEMSMEGEKVSVARGVSVGIRWSPEKTPRAIALLLTFTKALASETLASILTYEVKSASDVAVKPSVS
jgi:hypothetical protein